LLDFPPISFTVATTITKITASMTAYSAMSWPESSDQSSESDVEKWAMVFPFENVGASAWRIAAPARQQFCIPGGSSSSVKKHDYGYSASVRHRTKCSRSYFLCLQAAATSSKIRPQRWETGRGALPPIFSIYQDN